MELQSYLKKILLPLQLFLPKKNMNKILLALVSVFIGFVPYAQMDIKCSEHFHNIKDNCKDMQFITKDNGAYYFLYSLDEYISEGEFDIPFSKTLFLTHELLVHPEDNNMIGKRIR